MKRKEPAVELDEMKRTWGQIGTQLEQGITLNRAIVREAMSRRASDRLRTVWLGQIAQISLAAAIMALAIAYVSANTRVPHRLIAGVLLQAYGMLAIVLGGMTLAAIRGIDWSGPVVEIQRYLNRLRRLYVLGGSFLGLAWWLFWLPMAQVVLGLQGFDLYAHSPATFLWGTLGGLVGIVVSVALGHWWFGGFGQSPAPESDDPLAGPSVSGAFAELRRIREFDGDR